MMNECERAAEQYLRAQGHMRIVFEPDGNVPPDFVADSRLAVEVRRLNQNDHSKGRAEGLEEQTIPLLARMRTLLRSFGPPGSEESWFVTYHFSRPLEPWKELAPKLTSHLEALRYQVDRRPISCVISDHFSVRIAPAGEALSSLYVLAGFTDGNAGGWGVAEMIRNANHCILEKSAKVSAYSDRYPEWCLVLVDYIGFGLDDDHARALFLERVPRTPPWSRIVILNPITCTPRVVL